MLLWYLDIFKLLCLKVNLGKISQYWTPVKIGGGVGDVSESERRSAIVAQGGSVRFPISSPFWNHKSLKTTGIGEWRQILHPVKLGDGWAKCLSEFLLV